MVNEARENYAAAVHGYIFLLLTPFSLFELFKKNYWRVVTVSKKIESAPVKPFLKSTTPTPPPPPTLLPNFTSKEVNRPPHFENCSAGPVLQDIKRVAYRDGHCLGRCLEWRWSRFESDGRKPLWSSLPWASNTHQRYTGASAKPNKVVKGVENVQKGNVLCYAVANFVKNAKLKLVAFTRIRIQLINDLKWLSWMRLK